MSFGRGCSFRAVQVRRCAPNVLREGHSATDVKRSCINNTELVHYCSFILLVSAIYLSILPLFIVIRKAGMFIDALTSASLSASWIFVRLITPSL